MKQLFGTDGIRGHAGEFPLDEKTVRIIGASLARQFRSKLGAIPDLFQDAIPANLAKRSRRPSLPVRRRKMRFAGLPG